MFSPSCLCSIYLLKRRRDVHSGWLPRASFTQTSLVRSLSHCSQPFLRYFALIQAPSITSPGDLSKLISATTSTSVQLLWFIGMNEKSWNEYRKRALTHNDMLTQIEQHTDALKNNQFKKVQKPHPSLSYDLPVDFGGMGHFFFRRYLFNNVNLFPEEVVDYTPTLKQGVKTNSGEQTCYLGLDRRNNFKPNGSHPLATFDPIN